MKTDIPRIIKRFTNGLALVCFPSGEKRFMKIDDYFFYIEKKSYY